MILSGIQTLPTFRLFRDNPLRFTVNVGEDFDLDAIDDLEITYELIGSHGKTRPVFHAVEGGDSLTRDGQTIRLIAAPDAVSEDDAAALLSAIIATGGGAYALGIRGTVEEAPIGVAIVGDLLWEGPGAFEAGASAINNAVINLNVIDNEITVSVAVMTDTGAAVEFDLPAAIHAATAATEIADADEFPLSASSAWGLKKAAWSLIKSTLSTAFGSVFATAAEGDAGIAAKAKTDLLTVTGAVNLDTINERVNELDAAIVLKGVWNASGGTFPGSGSAKAGWSYIVSVAGTDGGIDFAVNDRVIALTNNASTSVYAANWHKADYTDQVLSVAGRTGAVALAVGDVTNAVGSVVAGITGADQITNIVSLTQAEYDAIGTKGATTLYVIV